MSESEMAVIKPEAMRSYIWLQTVDGSIQQVEEEVAMYCPMICRERLHAGMGASKNCAISLPQRVNPASLSLILDYCRFHQVPGRSNKERKFFDEKFIKMDTKGLCELTSAADALQLRPLVDLTSRALARMIEGKTPEEIREIFHLPDDLTEEEKLEPLRNITDDPRIRLLNRLYAKKRKELKERQKLKNIEVEEEQVDERSVDDLLSFINGNDEGDFKCGRSGKQKKKNRRRKEISKDVSSNGHNNACKKEVANLSNACNESAGTFSSDSSRRMKLQDMAEDVFGTDIEFEDDTDDELDPVMKEKLDRYRLTTTLRDESGVLDITIFNTQAEELLRTPPATVHAWEVEDFARRLDSDWLSLGQQRRLIPNIINGNCSLQRYQGLDRRL